MLGTSGAFALDTAGAPCTGNACRATDGNTSGGSCIGHYCVAGSGGTGGGLCFGEHCQAGNGGTGGGSCTGAHCKAGAGGTGGGACNGDGCQAGNGGTVGGSCAGADCKPGNRGRATPTASLPKNLNCCIAWAQLGLVRVPDFKATCDRLQTQNRSQTTCEYWDARSRTTKSVDPVVAVAPAKLPDPPTSLEAIREQTRRKPDSRCQFDCQAWNPASNSCIGPARNGCTR
jgi:hypothetical protein